MTFTFLFPVDVELYPHFFSYPLPEVDGAVPVIQYHAIPQIEQLAGYLLRPEYEGPEVCQISISLVSLG